MNILVCDDEPSVTAMVERFLTQNESIGHARVVQCHSMAELWKIIESGQHISMLFLDLVLAKDVPPLSGEDTIAQIPKLKEKCEHIIAISGYQKFEAAALAAGADYFLFKLGDMDTSQSFFEKLAKLFREMRPPTKGEEALRKLKEIIHKDPDGP